MMLEVKHLSKHCEGKKILEKVSFSIQKGEIFAILGQSGAGKSTIGKILLGLMDKTEGEVRFEGRELSSLESNEIQTIFQDPYSALNPSLRVRDILEEALLANCKLSYEERQRKIDMTLEKVGMTRKDGEKFPAQLSGGQRQRVCIAAAIIVSPKLIVCDEPIASLDLSIQEQILHLLYQINKEEGISIIFISHNLPAIYRIADRVLLLYRGEVQEIQSALDFFYQPQSDYGKRFLASVPFFQREQRA